MISSTKSIVGKITMLVSSKGCTIEIQDADANTQFLEIEMTAEEFCSAVGRMGNVSCKLRVGGLDRVGKVHENKMFSFEIPKSVYENYTSRVAVTHHIALKKCPKGWTPDEGYGSQSSFYSEDGKCYARCVIRRWTNKKGE